MKDPNDPAWRRFGSWVEDTVGDTGRLPLMTTTTHDQQGAATASCGLGVLVVHDVRGRTLARRAALWLARKLRSLTNAVELWGLR